jgi:regulator of sirC expression with transglutaminase-like and TPR domain
MSDLTFDEEIQRTPINIASAALRFAKGIAYPELDVDIYIEMLDRLGERAGKAFNQIELTRAFARDLSSFLFKQLGFRGNKDDYQDPRNSYLNQVLDRRLGIPISLSAIYLYVARKAGLSVEGISLPGHFLVRVKDFDGDFYIDPFNQGKIISLQECSQLVAASTGYHGPLQEEWLEPAAPGLILTRMLNNLRLVYIRRRDWEHALRVIEHARLLQSDMPELVRDQGIIYHQNGKLRLAVQYYEQYLSLAPNALDGKAIQTHLKTVAQQLARLN